MADFGFWIYAVFIWSWAWTFLALWTSARNNQKYWFLTHAVLGLFAVGVYGIVPIVYLYLSRKQVKGFAPMTTPEVEPLSGITQLSEVTPKATPKKVATTKKKK
ncbi:MAG TPA: hypothetical protein ENN60_02290 [archaeon]|nr:hypothetical protein [archaeon]